MPRGICLVVESAAIVPVATPSFDFAQVLLLRFGLFRFRAVTIVLVSLTGCLPPNVLTKSEKTIPHKSNRNGCRLALRSCIYYAFTAGP